MSAAIRNRRQSRDRRGRSTLASCAASDRQGKLHPVYSGQASPWTCGRSACEFSKLARQRVPRTLRNRRASYAPSTLPGSSQQPSVAPSLQGIRLRPTFFARRYSRDDQRDGRQRHQLFARIRAIDLGPLLGTSGVGVRKVFRSCAQLRPGLSSNDGCERRCRSCGVRCRPNSGRRVPSVGTLPRSRADKSARSRTSLGRVPIRPTMRAMSLASRGLACFCATPKVRLMPCRVARTSGERAGLGRPLASCALEMDTTRLSLEWQRSALPRGRRDTRRRDGLSLVCARPRPGSVQCRLDRPGGCFRRGCCGGSGQWLRHDPCNQSHESVGGLRLGRVRGRSWVVIMGDYRELGTLSSDWIEWIWGANGSRLVSKPSPAGPCHLLSETKGRGRRPTRKIVRDDAQFA